jgi:hypothetical protein
MKPASVIAALLVALGCASFANADPVLLVNGSGILTGAQNVQVGGTLYDVTFVDSHSINLFDDGAGTSVGADLSATVSTRRCPLMGTAAVGFFRAWLPGDTCTLTVANAGNAKQGAVTVYVSNRPL